MNGMGMDQTTARRRAEELGGIAVSARNPSRAKRWRLGGWPMKDDVWIVVGLNPEDHKNPWKYGEVLDDGPEEEVGI